MTDTKDQDRKTLSLGGRNKLELRRSDGDQVRQSFSHGRTKAVQVERKRKRVVERGKSGLADGGAAARRAAEGGAPAPQIGGGASSRKLTPAEREARERALKAAALAREAEEKRRAEEEARRKAAEAEAARLAAEAEAAREPEPAQPAKPEDLRRRELAELEEIEAAEKQRTQAETKRLEEEATKREAEKEREAAETERRREVAERSGAAAVAKFGQVEEEEEAKPAKRRGRSTTERRAPTPTPRPADRRRGKLTVTQVLSGDDEKRGRSLAAMRRARERQRMATASQPQEKIVRDVVLPEAITVQELANRMAERGGDVVKTLMRLGVMATINQSIDADTAELVVSEFGHRLRRVSEADVEEGLGGGEDTAEVLQSRAPVVTVMGHVDHGKTSLLDALRKTDVVAGEAGGITQHIGAYQVQLESGSRITFIDTPGHAAFTAMRARGANVTDIVVLVVAANDGVMPQTIEAIRHAKAAGAPIIVAINKIDLPDADPERVCNELLNHEIVVESLGGDTQTVEVSALNGQGLDQLEEAILLQAEILELKANPKRTAEGVVVEAKLDRGRGNVATVLVRRGTLRIGDIFVTGAEWGRVRALVTDRGEQVEEAGPATPVEVLGLQGAPLAGDDFIAVDSEARAREVSDYRSRKRREAQSAITGRGTLDQMFQKIQAGETKELPVVIKGDVQGSVEAIATSLEKLTEDNEEVAVRVLHAAVGGITESDITLAAASDAMIIGFNVRANPQARELARRDGVEIRYYSVIYEAIDDARAALTGMLSPTLRENFIGYAQIREVFNITRVGKVAGCYITDGVVKRGAKVRLLRDDVVIHEGTLKTLKRFKEEVREVREGYECGMAFENYDNIQAGDVIECFEVEEVARELAS